MDPKIASQDKQYRRGLVLGFTLAEIMVLIIFALMLALGAAIASTESEKGKLAEENKQLLYVRDRLDAVSSTLGEEDGKQLVAEVYRQYERQRELESLIKKAQAGAKVQLPPDVFVELSSKGIDPFTDRGAKEIVERLQLASVALEQSGVEREGDRNQKLSDLIALGRAVSEELSRDGVVQPNDAADYVRRLPDLVATVKNLQRKLEASGKGGDYPSCWFDQRGKPEYVFDIDILSSGVLIRPAYPEYRSGDYSRVAKAPVLYSTILGPEDFRRQTKQFFDYGMAQPVKCKFFVRLLDNTADFEKNAFKRHMLLTEETFYKFLSSKKE